MARVFTEKQEKLLAALVPGAQAGKFGNYWIVSHFKDGTHVSDDRGNSNSDFEALGWGEATEADFDTFHRYRLLDQETQSIYHFSGSRLVEVYNLNFDLPETK